MEFSITSEGTPSPPLKLWNRYILLFILYRGSKKFSGFNKKGGGHQWVNKKLFASLDDSDHV